VQNLHTGAKVVYKKDEHFTILQIAMHQVGHDATLGIETLRISVGLG